MNDIVIKLTNVFLRLIVSVVLGLIITLSLLLVVPVSIMREIYEELSN